MRECVECNVLLYTLWVISEVSLSRQLLTAELKTNKKNIQQK